MITWPSYVIYSNTNRMWFDHVPLPRRHPWSSIKSLTLFKSLKFNQILPCNQIFFQTELSSNIPTYSVSPTKLSLMPQFYDVRAYLWSASRRGSGGFPWKMSVLALEATNLLVLLTRCPTHWTQQGWLSGEKGC